MDFLLQKPPGELSCCVFFFQNRQISVQSSNVCFLCSLLKIRRYCFYNKIICSTFPTSWLDALSGKYTSKRDLYFSAQNIRLPQHVVSFFWQMTSNQHLCPSASKVYIHSLYFVLFLESDLKSADLLLCSRMHVACTMSCRPLKSQLCNRTSDSPQSFSEHCSCLVQNTII
jgi:hypothetical protein